MRRPTTLVFARSLTALVLAHWRADGTRERILSRWVPYWKQLEGEARQR
jgi:hypothetical protein